MVHLNLTGWPQHSTLIIDIIFLLYIIYVQYRINFYFYRCSEKNYDPNKFFNRGKIVVIRFTCCYYIYWFHVYLQIFLLIYFCVFSSAVAFYGFDDHNAPPFELMEPCCRDMDDWLSKGDNNVAIVHCKAGKVRVNDSTKLCTEPNLQMVE